MIEVYSIADNSLRSLVMFIWNRTFTEGGACKTPEWLLIFFFIKTVWVHVRKICSNTKAQRILKIKDSNL